MPADPQRPCAAAGLPGLRQLSGVHRPGPARAPRATQPLGCPSAWAWLVALAALTGCGHGPPPAEPTAVKALRAAAPPVYQNTSAIRAGATPAVARVGQRWWLAFDDPALPDLIDQADAHSPRLAQAAARWAQARAVLRGGQSAGRPQLGLGLDASRQGGPLVNAAGGSGTLISAGATLDWELDLFGALAQADAAAQADTDERQAQWQGARLALQAELAQALLALRTLDAEQALLQDQQHLLLEAQAITRRLQAAGLAAEAAGLQAASAAAGLDAEAQGLARRRGELVHALAVMAGRPASDFSLPPAAPAMNPNPNPNPATTAWSPGLAQADAVRDEAEAIYRARWLQALREVEDPLLALQALAAQAAAQSRITQAGERRLALAQGRQQRGLAGRGDALAAELALLQLQREAVRLHGDRLQASVALVRALGGGWDDAGGPGCR